MLMRVFVVSRPAPVVSLEEAKAHLKVTHAVEDAMIAAMVAVATGHIDGPNGWLGRAIGEQTLEARLDNFDCGSIRLPYAPLISVTRVDYVDSDGIERAVDPLWYELLGSSLVPRFGQSWPRPRWQREAVRIRYRAGYAAAPAEGAPAPVDADGGDRVLPSAIRSAILLMVGDLYRNRDTVAFTTSTAIPMSTTVEHLLAPLRVYH